MYKIFSSRLSKIAVGDVCRREAFLRKRASARGWLSAWLLELVDTAGRRTIEFCLHTLSPFSLERPPKAAPMRRSFNRHYAIAVDNTTITVKRLLTLLFLGVVSALRLEAQTNSAAAYTFTTLAGYSLSAGSDGLGPNARFSNPRAVATDGAPGSTDGPGATTQ